VKSIRIIVSPQGKATIETKGFSGADCRAASRLLEEALGHPVRETLTSEYYEEQPTRQSVHQGS
jgi:hypothetical protein